MTSGLDGDVVLARLVRNGVVESQHTGHVVVCDAGGSVLGALGRGDRLTYARSAVKPFQALAVLDALDAAGVTLDDDALAIACASHGGSDEQQIEAARLLAMAGLDESALQCPAAMPSDPAAAWSQRRPHPLAHNCSGKHAGFLYATVAAGDHPAHYLDPAGGLQRRIRLRLDEVSGTSAQGPGIDGCGAPAWQMPLHGIATAFARLAAGRSGQLARVARAMTAAPLLVGGPSAYDTRLMRCAVGVVAKRGAEAVFAFGLRSGREGFGVAVKITDGSTRADGPVAATMLGSRGYDVPADLARPPVLGGGAVQGALEIDAAVGGLAAATLPSGSR